MADRRAGPAYDAAAAWLSATRLARAGLGPACLALACLALAVAGCGASGSGGAGSGNSDSGNADGGNSDTGAGNNSSSSATRPQSTTSGSGSPAAAPVVVARAAGFELLQTHAGLLIDQPFTTAETNAKLTRDFELNGDSLPQHRIAFADANGLHIGVTAHQTGKFEGYFAVTKTMIPAGSVIHTRMSRPAETLTGAKRSGEAVFAIQTGNTKRTGLINYVLVATSAYRGLFHELVGYASGHIANARTKVLWQGPFQHQRPQTLDITLVTDGYRSLAVWINGREVYRSDSLKIDVQPPFQAYLEVQGLTVAYESRFQDFWVATGQTLTVTGIAAGTPAELDTAQGPIRATATASGATFRLDPLHARGSATLKRGGSRPAKFGPFDYAGGDAYAVKAGSR